MALMAFNYSFFLLVNCAGLKLFSRHVEMAADAFIKGAVDADDEEDADRSLGGWGGRMG